MTTSSTSRQQVNCDTNRVNKPQPGLQSEDGESQLTYWKQQLKGASPVLELPTDRPRPPVQLFRNARQPLELSKALTEALKALAQKEECTLFMTLDDQMPSLKLPELSEGSLKLITGTTANLDLSVALTESLDGLNGYFEYDTDLFEAATIARMISHFQTLLEGIVANPEQQLCDLPILTPTERHQLLVEWNDTEVDYPKASCIHQLIEAQVEQTPDAIAVVFEEQSLTYRELNNRANQMAHYVRSHVRVSEAERSGTAQSLSITAEVLVGISMERSLEKIVAVLGEKFKNCLEQAQLAQP